MGLLTNSFNEKSFLIVDTSYLIYTIAFRTFTIYSKYFDVTSDQEELYKIDFSQDEDYVSIFRKNFISTINVFKNKYNIPNSRIIFAIDCNKKSIWRVSFFKDYKIHRILKPKVETGVNNGPIFRYAFNTLLPELEEKNFGHIFSHDYCEADDIIAITHNLIRSNDDTQKIIILSSDQDNLQLIDDNTEVINVQMNSMRDKSSGDKKKDLLYKILLGDGADGIPSCFNKVKNDPLLSRGFGLKAATKLIENKQLLLEKLKQYPEAAKQFNLNRQIIDFSMIPEDIKNSVISKIRPILYNE